jgi:hypothetical protein
VTLHDAFDAARRELQDFVRRRQGHVKSHETPPHGRGIAFDLSGGGLQSCK